MESLYPARLIPPSSPLPLIWLLTSNTEGLQPIGSLFLPDDNDTGPTDPTDPGTGGGTVDFNGSDGLPVYGLSAGQAQYLTNGIQPLAGVYAVDVWIDPTTATESRTLVDAFDELGDGNWSAVMDPYGIPLSSTIDSTLFPTTPDLVAYFEQEGLQPIGSLFLPDDNDTGPTDPTDPGTGGGTVDFNGSDGLPVYGLSAGQAQYLTNGIQPMAGVYAVDVWIDPTTATEYRYLVDAIDELGDGNWSVVMDPYGIPLSSTIDSTLFPTTPDLVAYFEQEGLQPIGSLFLPDDNDTGPTDPTDPGTGGGTVDFNGSDGLPVYSLSAGQAQYLTNGIQPLAGVYAVDVWIDPTTATEYRYLVDAIDELGDGNWSVVMDPYGIPLSSTIDSTLFPTTPDLVAYFEQEGLQPIGSLFLPDDNDTGPTDPTDPGTGGGTVDFNGSDGLPVYSLSAGQAQHLTNGIQPMAGVYAVDVWIDPTTATESLSGGCH